MQFWVYLLRCADGSYYAGHSDHLEGRLWQHNQGIGCDWTSRRRPVELVWCEAVGTRDDAFAFERRIKGWSRAKKEALIAGDWDRISWLARPPHERSATESEKETARSELGPADVPRTSARPELSPADVPRTSARPELVEGRLAQTGDDTRPARPERKPKAEVEGHLVQPSRRRPSTSLRTSDVRHRSGGRGQVT